MSTQLINSPAINCIQQFRAVPQFWQYLGGLRADDLIAELIQNELDEDSSHTSITFDADRLTCQGNGYPVDKDGWTRLSFIMGTGDLAPRKRQRIGVKSHGLKVCFMIGDDIKVRSNGKLSSTRPYIRTVLINHLHPESTVIPFRMKLHRTKAVLLRFHIAVRN